MIRSSLDSAALVNESRNAHIKMKAAFTIWTGRKMTLHNSDFLGAELPPKIEMETSNSLITVHYRLSSNIYPPISSYRRFVLGISVNSNIKSGAFIPTVSAIYCNYHFPSFGKGICQRGVLNAGTAKIGT